MTFLYIGGFELPDKNAAAQRVVGIANGLKELGNNVVLLNSLKHVELSNIEKKEYFGFECYEYKREREYDYLFSAKSALSMIKKIRPDAIIAYNYPAVALERIRKYCHKNGIKCYVDSTEWYQAIGGNIIYRFIKNLDTAYRMYYVQKKVDGVIAISRFLYEYYKNSVKTVLIPPTVNLSDEKWRTVVSNDSDVVSFVYAGVPIALKEKLDIIVSNIEHVSKEKNVILNVVGITESQFVEMYNWTKPISNAIKFWGRVEHKQVIELVKSSDWAIILRDNNKVVKAGFPTKVVEAISCGTPVIVNEFSNVCDYINSQNGIVVDSFDSIFKAITDASKKRMIVNNSLFDYHNYLHELQELL